MATYKDIARISNVSKTTVSHAINKTRYVAPKTVKRIEEAMNLCEEKPSPGECRRFWSERIGVDD